MKFARVFLIIFGSLIVLGGVLFGVALLPSVQRWAVLRAAQGVPGLKLEVAEVKAGFSGVTVSNLQAEQQKVVVKVERLEADFSLLGFLFGRNLDITRLAVTGVNVDASHMAGAKAGSAAAAPAATPGLLAKVKLPFDLRLDDTRIEGRALLPGAANQPPFEAQFTITGGKIAAGQEGLLQLVATLRDPAPNAPVTNLRVQAGLRATLSTQRTFSKVTLTTLVDAEGPSLSGGQSQLKVAAELYHSSVGENYEVGIDTVLRGTTENVLKLQAQLPEASHQYTGDWQLKARTVQVAPFALGAPLPDFDVKGSGKFAFDPVASSASLQGSLQGQLNKLETINPDWKAFGTVKVDATFDVGQQGAVLNLNQFQAVVAGAQPVLEARITAPIRYDLRKNQLVASSQAAENLVHVNLAGLPVEWLQPFVTLVDISGGMITGQFDVARVAGTGTAAAVHGQVQLADLTAKQDGRPLLQHASVTLRTEATLTESVIEAPVLEFNLKTPEGDTLTLAGKISTQTGANPPLTVAGTFNATSPKLFARWLPGAPVSAQGELNATLQGDKLDVRSGRLQVQQGTAKPLVSATVLQSFSADLATQHVTPGNAADAIARIEITRLPLGLLALTESGATLGGFAQGEFEISAPAGKVVFKGLKPAQLTDVSLTQGKQPALTGLALEASPIIEYTNAESFRVQSGDITVRNAAKATLLTLKAEATQTPDQGTQATVNFTLEIPALATQPLFADAQAVSAGKAAGEIRAVLGAHRQVEARLTLNGLIAAGSGHTLPVANIGFRAISQPSGAMSIQVPVLLDNSGRRSDLNFALELSPLGAGHSVDGKLTGQQVELEDVLGVLSVFTAAAAPENADKPVVTAPRSPDTVAAWSQFSGQLSLDVKAVTYGKDWSMTALTGAVAIEPTRLALDKLTASFSETSRLAAKVEMRFNGGAVPYRLTGDYSLNDFDVGKLFKAIDPAKPPTIDGLFTVTGKLSGNGEIVQRALERAHGDFQLTSRKGVFRGLARTSNKVSMTSKAVELGASVLGSLFGGDKGAKIAEKGAGVSYFLDQLAPAIAEINYDLFNVKLSRDEQLNMQLEDFSLVAPELRLNGRGEVTYAADKPLLQQPLTATLNLAVRGKLEQQFGKVRALGTDKDDLGYTKAKEPIPVAGTLGSPNINAFFTKLAMAKIGDLLDSGQ